MENTKRNSQREVIDYNELSMTESATFFKLYKKWIKNASDYELQEELRKIKLWWKEPHETGAVGKELLHMAENSIKNELNERSCEYEII